MNKSIFITLGIIGVIIIIIYIVIYFYIVKLLKFTKNNILSINYAATNNSGCRDILNGDNNDNCKYNDLSLDIPQFSENLFKPFNIDNSRDFYIMSYYCANLVGKLSYVLFNEDLGIPNISPKKDIKDLDIINSYYYNNKIICLFLSTKIGILPKRFFVLFRGTKNLKEWEKDFDYLQGEYINTYPNIHPEISNQIKFDFTPNQMNNMYKLNDILLRGDYSDILIHRGFMDIYSTFRDKLINDILLQDTTENMYIYISGHSLGAALSSILSFDLGIMNNKFNICNITIASPRIGNINFSLAFNSIKNLSYLQWNNLCDIIPSLPISVMPNINNPYNPYFYQSLGNRENIIIFNNNLKSIGNNHQLPGYIEYIKSLISSI